MTTHITTLEKFNEQNLEAINRQDLLIDCEVNDMVYLRPEGENLHVITAWGEDIGVLPKEVQNQIETLLDDETYMDMRIVSLMGDYGEIKCSIKVRVGNEYIQ